MHFSLFSSILLIGAAQGAFLALALVTLPKGAKRANFYLALFVFAYVFELTHRYAVETGLIQHVPVLIPLNWALDLWFGPLVFFYTLEITNFTKLTNSDRYKHLLLPAAGFVLAVLTGLFAPTEKLLGTLGDIESEWLYWLQVAFAVAGLLSMLTYLAKNLLILHKHQKQVTDNFSYQEKVNLNWLRNLLGLLGILLLLYVTLGLYQSESSTLDTIYPIAMVLVVFLIGFIGIRQSVVFIDHPIEQAHFVASAPEKLRNVRSKYKKSALSIEEARSIYHVAADHVDRKELFRQSDLSLPRLADQLGLPSHYISQAINQESGSHFFDFINQRRVKYVSNILNSSDAKKVNILDLAMDAGFNSKSAFYSAFKAKTGQTPSQFRKANQTLD